jgi:hypothetical protein
MLRVYLVGYVDENVVVDCWYDSALVQKIRVLAQVIGYWWTAHALSPALIQSNHFLFPMYSIAVSFPYLLPVISMNVFGLYPYGIIGYTIFLYCLHVLPVKPVASGESV